MPSKHLLLCHPLLLLPSLFPSIRVFSNELTLHIRWPKYWSFNISPSNDFQGWFPLGLTGLISLQYKWLSRVLSSTTVQKHQFYGAQPSLWSSSYIHTWLLETPELWLSIIFVSILLSIAHQSPISQSFYFETHDQLAIESPLSLHPLWKHPPYILALTEIQFYENSASWLPLKL